MQREIRLLTTEEAARELGVSTDSMWRFVTEGRLTASVIDGRCVLSELQLVFFKRNHAGLIAGESLLLQPVA